MNYNPQIGDLLCLQHPKKQPTTPEHLGIIIKKEGATCFVEWFGDEEGITYHYCNREIKDLRKEFLRVRKKLGL
jgi:pyruvate formate-lyase activating enzyme-like uncharacterized protein